MEAKRDRLVVRNVGPRALARREQELHEASQQQLERLPPPPRDDRSATGLRGEWPPGQTTERTRINSWMVRTRPA